jgi:hypothetical protein
MMDDLSDDGGVSVYLGPISNRFVQHNHFSNFCVANDDKFIISHLNCNHLLPHIREMRLVFEDSPVGVIGVNETFLTEPISSKSVEIKGYK